MSGPAGSTLVLTTSYPREPGDPAGHFVEAEVLTLRSRGARVRVLAAGRAGARRASDEARGRGIEWLGGAALFAPPGALERLRERPRRAWSLLPAAARALSFLLSAPERRVVAHWLVPWGLLLLATPKSAFDDVRLVAHGSDVRLLLRAPALARFCLERWARRGFRLRLVSTELQRELLGIPRLSLRARRWLAHAKIEAAELRLPEVPSAPAARELLGLSSGDFVVLVMARLVPDKRTRLALRWARAHASGARLWVVGAGPLRTELEEEFPEASFLGALPRSEALTRLRAADLLLAPSAREGAPTVVREARALGTRVLAQPVGDVPAWAQLDTGIELFDFGTLDEPPLPIPGRFVRGAAVGSTPRA